MSHEIDPVGSPGTVRSGQEGVILFANQPIVRKIVEGLTFLVAPDIQVNGKENLKEAITVTGGKNLIFMLNHLSNFDTPAFELALRRAGFGEIVPKLIYLQGIKLDRNPVAKIFLGAYHRIKVWPPDLTAKNGREKEQRLTITRNSFDASDEALEKGYSLAIFGEGGRSYNGQLKQAAPTIVRYLMLRPDTIVIPVAISGTQKVLPRKNFIPNPFGSQVSVSFGEYVDIRSLINDEKFRNLPDSKRNKEIIDFIMKKIAIMLPEDERGVYA